MCVTIAAGRGWGWGRTSSTVDVGLEWDVMGVSVLVKEGAIPLKDTGGPRQKPLAWFSRIYIHL